MSTVASTPVHDLPLWALLAISAVGGAVIAGSGALLLSLLRRASRRRKLGSGQDDFTGVASRRAFVAELEAAWRAAQERSAEFGLLIVDIDRFADINELYGRSTGDRVLEEVAQRIRGRVRASDFVARIDADEFAVICHGTAAENLDSVRRNLEAFVNHAESVPVALSIGIAVPEATDERSLQLLDRARKSLAERRKEQPTSVVDDALTALLSAR